MIKINKKNRPGELTDAVQKALTAQYIENPKKAVWKKPYIIEALLESSHHKCSYCECILNEEGKYMEVEHFKPKSIFPHLVVDWDNLLPSCKRCNGNKSNSNPDETPIIDPSKINPKDHLTMVSYRLRTKAGSEIGKATIDFLDLNDSDKLAKPRFIIGEQIHKTTELIIDLANEYDDSEKKSIRRRNRVTSATKNLLLEGAPEAAYAATVATELMNSDDFEDLRKILENNDLWTDELDQLFETVGQNSLSDK